MRETPSSASPSQPSPITRHKRPPRLRCCASGFADSKAAATGPRRPARESGPRGLGTKVSHSQARPGVIVLKRELPSAVSMVRFNAGVNVIRNPVILKTRV